MRPLTALLSILTGSVLALAIGLLLTWVTTLFLNANEMRFAPERMPLMKAVIVFTMFSAASAAALYGDAKKRPWRFQAYAATFAMFAAAVWMYWPT